MSLRDAIRPAVLAACLMTAPLAASAANIFIVNNDGVGEGFNDPTAATPVGGNPETSIGAQRLYVFQYAANIWGDLLPSNVNIFVQAQFNPQSCTATSGTLGSAGPLGIYRDFPGAPVAGHWYHVALANKLRNADLNPAGNDINITFNSSIGQPTCLPAGWYYGVDGNEGAAIELLPVVLHEMGHGLGFSTSTSGSSGFYQDGYPSIYDHFLYDNVLGLHWDQMTAGQRVTSATACTRLVWDGPWVTQHAPALLADQPVLRVNAPAAIDGDYDAGPAAFGAAVPPAVTGNVVLANDGVANPSNGCEPFVNAGAINGNIALVDRGTCGFTIKVKNAQNAGAIAVVVADSVGGCPLPGMAGNDPTITIPSLRISQADANLIKNQLGAGVNVTLTRDPSRIAGADAAGRVRMYTPSMFSGGSSISHWDVTADPDLLMEPALNTGLSQNVDLARWHFADIGWFDPNLLAAPETPAARRLLGNHPNPFAGSTAIDFALEREQDIDLAIHDLSGRLVARLASGRTAGGSHTVRWDGRDRDGRVMAPGVYLYRLRAGERVESRPMVLFE